MPCRTNDQINERIFFVSVSFTLNIKDGKLTTLRPVSNVLLLPCCSQMNLTRQWHGDTAAVVSNVELNSFAPNSNQSRNRENKPSIQWFHIPKMVDRSEKEGCKKFALMKNFNVCVKP